MTEKSPTDQRCGMWRCPSPLPALLLEAGTAGLLAFTAAGQYPRTRPSLSLALRHDLRLLPPLEEVPVCFNLSPSRGNWSNWEPTALTDSTVA